MSYKDIADNVAKLVEEKQEAYGNSFGKSCSVLEVLYPDGVKPADYPDLLTVVRVLDKLFRVATNKDAFGESPWKDIMGYSLLATYRDYSDKYTVSKDSVNADSVNIWGVEYVDKCK